MHDVQSNKSAKPNWFNGNIHKTQFKFMYGGTFKDPKNLRDKHVTFMKNNLEIYGDFQHRTTFHQVRLSTYDPV